MDETNNRQKAPISFRCSGCESEMQLPSDTFIGHIGCPYCGSVYAISIQYQLLGPAPFLKFLKSVKITPEFIYSISSLLRNTSPELEWKRQGAWQTFRSKSSDYLSQASHSIREVFSQLLYRTGVRDVVSEMSEWEI